MTIFRHLADAGTLRLLPQGYWRACYGPHGVEILRVRLLGATEPGTEHCPNGTGPRLVVVKVPRSVVLVHFPGLLSRKHWAAHESPPLSREHGVHQAANRSIPDLRQLHRFRICGCSTVVLYVFHSAPSIQQHGPAVQPVCEVCMAYHGSSAPVCRSARTLHSSTVSDSQASHAVRHGRLQVTGDPNVPAGKVTLFTKDGPPTVGRFDGFQLDADGIAQPDRPMGACALV